MSIADFLYTFTASFIALFPVMNPIGSGFIVNGFLEGMDDAERKVIFRKIAFNCLMIGLGSLAVGHLILLVFGLAVPIIQLAGGIIICRTAWGFLSDSPRNSAENKAREIRKLNVEEIENQVFYPISFPISLGPGSISVIFTMMALAPVRESWLNTGINYLLIALVIVLMCGILYLFLTQGNRILRKMGTAGSMIINKMVAFITFCIGMQIIVKGIANIFHLNVL